MWLEKNAFRSTEDESFGVNSSGTRSCGVSPGDSCPGTNVNRDDPDPSWNGTYPTSLYQGSAPSWWCEEACEWSQAGIGAFGDDFGGTLCKLPAQIRFEGGTCTPLDGQPVVLPPFFLLD